MTELAHLTYSQKTGQLFEDGVLIAECYSGAKGPCRDNPAYERAKACGPIPRGEWWLASVRHSQRTGPVTIDLVPAKETETFGRTAFCIHGDNAGSDASRGCIICPRPTRDAIARAMRKGVRYRLTVEA